MNFFNLFFTSFIFFNSIISLELLNENGMKKIMTSKERKNMANTLEEIFKHTEKEEKARSHSSELEYGRGIRVMDEIKKRYSELKDEMMDEGMPIFSTEDTQFYEETFRMCKMGLLRAFKLVIDAKYPTDQFFDYKKVQQALGIVDWIITPLHSVSSHLREKKIPIPSDYSRIDWNIRQLKELIRIYSRDLRDMAYSVINRSYNS